MSAVATMIRSKGSRCFQSNDPARCMTAPEAGRTSKPSARSRASRSRARSGDTSGHLPILAFQVIS